MKIKEQFCSNEKCPHYGIAGKGNIYATTTYRAGKRTRKMLRCRTCGARFSERRNTPLFYLHTKQDTIEKIVKALAEGNSIRATGRIMDIDKNTICRILDRVATHCEKISAYLIKELHLTEIQLDELWSFVKKKRRTLDH